MNTQTYRILIDSSYDELPREATHYVNRLVTKASKNPFVLEMVKGFYDSAIKIYDIEHLLNSAFIEAVLNKESKRAGCFWYLKTKILLVVFSLLTGVAIPKLLKQNYCLFLQSLFIATYLVKEGYVNESPFNWDYE